METDLTELEGISYECIDDCALCCLCQPELDMKELMHFRKAGLEEGLTTEHVQGFVSDEPTAVKMQGGNGACHFLKERRCTVYEKRPKFCRQFPVRIHALHRIQLNANLSCPGLKKGGNSLLELGSGILKSISEKKLDIIMSDVGDRIHWFEDHAKNLGTHRPPDKLRSMGGMIIPLLENVEGIGKVLAFVNSEPDIGTMPPEEILNLIEETHAPDDLEEIAINGNYSLLELDDPAWLPVYVDDELKWNAFRSGEGKVHWMNLEENGTLTMKRSFDLTETGLLSANDEAMKTFGEYGALLNTRDHFLGYAYHVSAIQHFRYDLLTVYLGLLSTTMLDVWWRAGLIARMNGADSLDGKLAGEGIRAYDMTCLALPTMGEFV